MGEVWVRVRIGSLDGSVIKDVDALVNTGATDTAVPRDLADELGLPAFYRDAAETASGEVEYVASAALVEVEGRRKIVPVMIINGLDKVLIGQTTLETLNLMVDPGTGRLVRKRRGALLY
ncbi:retroviral-like aspartic protease family protein [Vulcanisaeta sp. JCM 14467]|uniref:retroviral-like aspartic protease family protein n=1 Tax=Vulcanisaeta sp. JCM 14467 TaxID=1295370 RepID=UPI0006CFD665|nr:retroviral-like aspartic protease family protein [Vulcanisaeta sp. JCM 14467]